MRKQIIVRKTYVGIHEFPQHMASLKETLSLYMVMVICKDFFKERVWSWVKACLDLVIFLVFFKPF